VKLPEGVDSIGPLSFLGCKLLQNVTFTNPTSVKIRQYAFEGLGPDVAIHKGEKTELVGIEDVRCTVDTRMTADDAPCEIYEPRADPRMTWSELVMDHRERQKIPGVRPRRGTYGTVYKCQHRGTGAISAVKELLPSEAVNIAFTREIETLAKLRHPAVLGIIGFVMPDERDNIPPQIITEWMPNGSLEDLLKNPSDYAMLTNTQKMKIIVGVCQGMRYIHMCRSIHRDLKPANILLDKDFEPRIADMGSAKFTDVGATLNNTLALGTPLYMAPEVLNDEKYGPGVDVFSFAMTLWEVVTVRTLLREFEKELATVLGWMQKVENGKRPQFRNLNVSVQEVLINCWSSKPTDRWSFDDLLVDFKKKDYQLLEGVDADVVKEYVERLETYEKRFPPRTDMF
jgi:serine/threonine protein kinase